MRDHGKSNELRVIDGIDRIVFKDKQLFYFVTMREFPDEAQKTRIDIYFLRHYIKYAKESFCLFVSVIAKMIASRQASDMKGICTANFPYQLHRDHPIIIFNSGFHCASALESRSHYTRTQCSNYGIMKSNDFKRFTTDLLPYISQRRDTVDDDDRARARARQCLSP